MTEQKTLLPGRLVDIKHWVESGYSLATDEAKALLQALETALGKVERLRKIAEQCQYCDGDHTQRDYEGNEEPCEGCYFRMSALKEIEE